MSTSIESVRISLKKPDAAALALHWCTTETQRKLTRQWLSDPRPCKAYIYGIAKEELGIALLSRMNVDPQGKHAKPWLVDFVIVAPHARRRGVATALMNKIRTVDEATAFCSSDESEKAFLKAGFHSHGIVNHTTLMRTA